MTTPISPDAKVLDRAKLLHRFGRPRSFRLVFTNGCFDILHPGHVRYLDTARRLGDALVVGVNTDDSVRRLKGPSRPLVRQRDRAMVLAALASVDAVTLFDEDTPLGLISALLPDLLVKGGDYDVDEIVGRQEVRAGGGEVLTIPFVPGYSTTTLLKQLKERA